MQKLRAIILIVLLCNSLAGNGQVVIELPNAPFKPIDPVRFEGYFRVDSIRSWEMTHLIYVTAMDSVSTSDSMFLWGRLGGFTKGLHFTIVSYKDERDSKEIRFRKLLNQYEAFLTGKIPFYSTDFDLSVDTADLVKVGHVYWLTTEPYGGAWTICHDYNNWNNGMWVRHPIGKKIRIPLPLVNTQLMTASELKGLHFGGTKQLNVSHPRFSNEDVIGEYRLTHDGKIYADALPAIKLYVDYTFLYTAPGMSGECISYGKWEWSKKGILLNTAHRCIGANIEYMGAGSRQDSVDVSLLFLWTLKDVEQIKIQVGRDEIVHSVDRQGKFRTTSEILNNATAIVDDIDYYPICNKPQSKNGDAYKMSILDNPYYPIIDNEEWRLVDGCLIRGKGRKKTKMTKVIQY